MSTLPLQRWWIARCLALTLAMAGGPAWCDETRDRAAEIAYRLDLELGDIDAAQRHLLVARLLAAREGGELRTGASLADDWLVWEQRLEQLEPALGGANLPAWFDPLAPDTVSAVLAFHDAGLVDFGWRPEGQLDDDAERALRLALDQDRPQSARALMPPLLAWARSHGPTLWAMLLGAVAREPELGPLVEPLVRPWLAQPLEAPIASWRALEDQAAKDLAWARSDAGHLEPAGWVGRSVDLLNDESLMWTVRDDGRMARIRIAAFLNTDRLDRLDRALLSLADAVLRVEAGGHVELLGSLAGIAQLVLTRHDLLDARRRVLVTLDHLGRLDPWLPGQLARIDGRLLTVYQQLRRLLRSWGETDVGGLVNRTEALHDLGSLGSALELLSSDLDGYLAQPVRQDVENRLLICFGLGNEEGPHPQVPIGPEDFDECVAALIGWARESAASIELSGDATGPFEDEHRARELEFETVQRINYWLGYQGRLVDGACPEMVAQEQVNPLEWALASRALVRFAERWPAYFAAAGLDDRVQALLEDGRRLLGLWESVDRCRSQGVNGMLVQLERYQQTLARFAAAVDQATENFREQRLQPAADVRLDGGAWQSTRYQPVDRLIGPCEGTASCGMSAELTPSRALYDLFPVPLLVADQIGLGQVSMCYESVQWVDRRAELPEVPNPAMANYFGRLSFDLVGRYEEYETPVFRLRLTSARDYEYLFGANIPEVLDDPCPRDLAGTKVESQLPEQVIQLVPRRLTYLTAERTQPAKVFDQHWAQGDEWRDWFVTGGSGVEVIERTEADDAVPAVNQRLAELYRDWNTSVYSRTLSDDPFNTDADTEALREVMRDLDQAKRTAQSMARLLFPEAVKNDPALRASLYGTSALFDQRVALQMQRDGVPVASISALAMGQYQDSLLLWRRATAPRQMSRIQPDRMVASSLLRLLQLSPQPVRGAAPRPTAPGQ